MRFVRALMACGGLVAAVACQPAERAAPPVPPAKAVPAANPSPDVAADLAPNADAARYGPHGVAATPPPAPTVAPRGEAEAAPGTAPPLPAGGDLADMRGHPCECGKTCHCGHCSGAVPGCHCHIKRADGKSAE